MPRPRALGADGAAVGLDDVFGDEEAVAGGVDIHPLRILAVAPFSEEVRHILCADAYTCVLNREDVRISLLLKRYINRAFGGIGNRIIKQVAQHVLGDLLFITYELEARRLRRERKLETLRRCRTSCILYGIIDKCREVKRCFDIFSHSPLLIGSFENIHDGRYPGAYLRERTRHERPQLIGERAEIALEEGCERPLILGQGALDLMANEVDERFLFLISLLACLGEGGELEGVLIDGLACRTQLGLVLRTGLSLGRSRICHAPILP